MGEIRITPYEIITNGDIDFLYFDWRFGATLYKRITYEIGNKPLVGTWAYWWDYDKTYFVSVVSFKEDGSGVYNEKWRDRQTYFTWYSNGYEIILLEKVQVGELIRTNGVDVLYFDYDEMTRIGVIMYADPFVGVWQRGHEEDRWGYSFIVQLNADGSGFFTSSEWYGEELWEYGRIYFQWSSIENRLFLMDVAVLNFYDNYDMRGIEKLDGWNQFGRAITLFRDNVAQTKRTGIYTIRARLGISIF